MNPALNYESGKVIYEGTFRHRNWLTFCGMILNLCVMLAGTAVLLAPIKWRWQPAFAALILGGGSGFLVFGWRLVTNMQTCFEIRTDGIYEGRRLTRWDRISSVSAWGKPNDRQVALFYTRFHRGKYIYSESLHELRLNVLLKADYEKLIKTLRDELGGNHPYLRFGGLSERLTPSASGA